MKALTLSLFFFLVLLKDLDALDPAPGKVYVFNYIEQVTPSDGLGNTSGTSITIDAGVRFVIKHLMPNGDLVIAFNEWESTNNQKKYNYQFDASGKSTGILLYFLLARTVFDNSCKEYVYVPNWDISFGTLTTPFRFRHQPFLYTNNVSLGATIAFTKKIYQNFSVGVVPGISLTKVELDKFSTNGFVEDKTERPALTPSISLLFGYKNINVTAGIGWDIVNRVSDTEKSWIYNGAHWFGIGIGINLFSSNKESDTAEQPADQTNKKAK